MSNIPLIREYMIEDWRHEKYYWSHVERYISVDLLYINIYRTMMKLTTMKMEQFHALYAIYICCLLNSIINFIELQFYDYFVRDHCHSITISLQLLVLFFCSLSISHRVYDCVNNHVILVSFYMWSTSFQYNTIYQCHNNSFK